MSFNWKLCLSLCYTSSSHTKIHTVHAQFFFQWVWHLKIVPLLCQLGIGINKIQNHNLHSHSHPLYSIMGLMVQYVMHAYICDCVCACVCVKWNQQLFIVQVLMNWSFTHVQHTSTTTAASTATIPSFNYSNELGWIFK